VELLPEELKLLVATVSEAELTRVEDLVRLWVIAERGPVPLRPVRRCLERRTWIDRAQQPFVRGWSPPGTLRRRVRARHAGGSPNIMRRLASASIAMRRCASSVVGSPPRRTASIQSRSSFETHASQESAFSGSRGVSGAHRRSSSASRRVRALVTLGNRRVHKTRLNVAVPQQSDAVAFTAW
jgi:hypothetical protein